MKLIDLDIVGELKRELEGADAVLSAFRQGAPKVQVRAHATSNHNFGCGYSVDLLPVDSAVAISAAERERSKVIDKLRALGVQVE